MLSQETTTLQIAQRVPCTEAEGPGRRFALWFQGCPLRCAECCNPEMLPFTGGETVPVDEVLAEIDVARRTHAIEGITLLGGEPFAHATSAAALSSSARRLGLSVMIFSGYTLSELQAMDESAVEDLLAATDLLVDGPYDRSQPDNVRRWVGSRNQKIHFLTDRYRADDACWKERDTLELRWDGEELVVNGFPAVRAKSVWRRSRT